MSEQFSRTEMLIGKDNVNKLNNSKVAVFGIGGVGSFVVEALARAGIGNFILVDNDIVSESNINRQIIATHETVGLPKVLVAQKRILEINPDANIKIYKEFFMPESKELITKDTDYVIDAVDTITAKIELIVRANKLNIPIISCMGTGNKLDPTKFEITDIYKTSVCPLAKVMRKELKLRGIKKLKVLYSKEEPIKNNLIKECSIEKDSDINMNLVEENCNEKKGITENTKIKKQVPASISFVPSVAGLIIAGEVIKDIINK